MKNFLKINILVLVVILSSCVQEEHEKKLRFQLI